MNTTRKLDKLDELDELICNLKLTKPHLHKIEKEYEK